MSVGFRCRATSVALHEPLRGTASVEQSWLLLEVPGPWASDVLSSSRLPPGLGSALQEKARAVGLRVLFIRRHGRHVPRGAQCFLASTGPGTPWLEQVHLDDPWDVLGLDLERLARGQRCEMREVHGPLFCVCTHGRHDVCCSENGRPVARILSSRHPARTWETSHIGGDRFAANLICFPHGLYFGRVPPHRAAAVVDAYSKGAIKLAYYRGRSSWSLPVQAAEYWLRQKKALVGINDVRLLGHGIVGEGVVAARFVTHCGHWTVRVRERVQAVRPLTCHAGDSAGPHTYDLIDIEVQHAADPFWRRDLTAEASPHVGVQV